MNQCAASKIEDCAPCNKGNKENKIRFFGTPKQIYNTFANQRDDDGKLAMSYKEFFNALCPYNYAKVSDNNGNYFENNEKSIDKIMRIADVDKDGLISFSEFFFFVLVVQTPEAVIKADFKKCGGKMTIS